MGRPKLYETAADFWACVRMGSEEECWIFVGPVDKNGYGMTRWQGKNYRAHRLSILLTFGDLDPNLDVLHSCDNPGCCNPYHLKQGTAKENIREAISRNRWSRKTGEDNPFASLNKGQVLEILTSNETGVSLARRFKVAQSTISMVRKRNTWKHIEVPDEKV